jgi:ATP-dependent RNA helicase DDX10/DBP4
MNLLAKKAFKSYIRSIHLMPNKQIFPGVTGLPLEEYAFSLGLASMPTIRFLKKLKNREEERKKKNVDYKLLQLKEEIKKERLEKKIAKLGGKTLADSGAAASRKEKRSRESDDDSDDDNDDGLLVVKQVHEWGDKSEPLPDVQLNEASKSRHVKKIRVDGSSVGANKKIVFNDDGEVEDDMIHATAPTCDDAADSHQLKSAQNDYLQRVRDRLTKTRELDRQEEKERIQEKHRKKKQKEKGENIGGDTDEEDEEVVVTLGGASESESNDEDSAPQHQNLYDEESDSDDTNNDNDDGNIKAQEELALSMLAA